MRLGRLLSLSAATLLVGTAAAPLPAIATGGTGAPNFHIVASGPYTIAFEVSPCGGFRIIGTGSAASGTHIGGKARFATSECARPDFAAGVNRVDGHAVVTASNGDVVFVHYLADSPPPDFQTGTFHDDGTFAIEGGTGRFDGATGSGRMIADGTLDPQIVTAHFDGTIELHPAGPDEG
jgi:hypothetical protein